jgi:hypothetical protein
VKKILVVGITILFIGVIIQPVECFEQKDNRFLNQSDSNEIKASTYNVTANNDNLPDLLIELNITDELTHWRVRATIHNKGTATIPAGIPIVWKIGEGIKSLYWMKVIPFSPFEPNSSIKGLPESQEITFNKLRWRGHEIQAIVDPPFEEDYPWIELDPDPVFGLIKELNENNNFNTYKLIKVTPSSLYRILITTKNKLINFLV